MRPKTIGRTLGIGLRVATRVASQHMAAHAQAAGHAQANQQVTNTGSASSAEAQSAGRTRGSLAKGIGGFLRPFGRVGHALWLEVMGVFFLLPALIFSRFLWRDRASWLQGPEHAAFVVSAIIVAVFLYLGISSFRRAWRK
jgi:hypothetical protein